ncbi:hypothetical protein TWF281_003640 [Arthrobotrys megalospora]
MRFTVGALALLAAAGRASAQCDGACQCEIDECFAVLAGTSIFPAQPTVDDCRDFLWVRSTWGSDTFTVTSTVTSDTVTDTVAETVFVTISQGTTAVETVTNTVTATRTTTSGDGSFTGQPVTTVVAPLRRRRRKRQANPVPSYASACGGSAGYSSACTCIGISADGTRWIEVPTVTTTVTSGVTATETVSETETITSTEIADATETETLVKTATQVVTQPLYTSFLLQVTSDEANGQYAGYFLRWLTDPANSNRRRLRLTPNIADAVLYKADASGKITTDAGDFGFARDDGPTGPALWQESAAGKTGWIDYTCILREDRLLDCAGSTFTYTTADLNDDGGIRQFAYIHNAFMNNCLGPLVIAAVPQDTTTVAPAAAKEVIIRAKDIAQNGVFRGLPIGVQDQASQPLPRIRFFDSEADAVRFKVDPTTGNIFGPFRAPFLSVQPTVSQPTPFLLGWYNDGTHFVQHMTVQLPGTTIITTYPADTRYLGAVVPTDSTGIPFFRVHIAASVNADEAGPLELEIVEV